MGNNGTLDTGQGEDSTGQDGLGITWSDLLSFLGCCAAFVFLGISFAGRHIRCKQHFLYQAWLDSNWVGGCLDTFRVIVFKG